jgi:hypothetical protein
MDIGGARGVNVGTGKSNTNAIVAALGSPAPGVYPYAAKLRYDLVLNGYDD